MSALPEERGLPPVPGPASRLGLWIVAVVLAVDQAAKWAAEAWLPFGQPVDLIPFLSLYLTYNTGIAFSFFAGLGSTAVTVVTVGIAVAVVVIWARARDGGTLAAIGFALIVGGAVGNLVDRFVAGHVVDYLLLHFGDRTLFVFNLADVALTVGPICLVAAYILPRRA